MLVKALEAIGVKRVYGIIGTSVLDFVDTLYEDRDKIRYVTTRHEQVAVNMADAEARVTSRPGVALVHAGPGFLNSLIGLGIAYRDRVPILLITGGVRRRLRSTEAWLEVNQHSIAEPLSKCVVRLESPEEALEALREAIIKLLEAPRGPVVVEVPEDLWNKKVTVPNEFFKELKEYKPKHYSASQDDVINVLKKFEEAERPLLLVCGEVARHGVEPILTELLDRLGAYAVVTGNGRGACPEDHPKCLGRVGFGGGSIPSDKALEEADFLLVLGNEFDDITTYAYTVLPKGDIIVVSLDPVVDKRPKYYEVVKADPYLFAVQLLKTSRSENLSLPKPSWDQYIASLKDTWKAMIVDALNRSYKDYVNPAKFFKKLDEALPRNRIITGGQGTHVLYTYDFMRVYSSRSFLAATNLGAMSYAFPAALGAKLARPDLEVVAVVGDGDFMMTVQDLETAVREEIAVKTIVVNDFSYRVLLLRQKIQRMGRVYGTLLGNPDFSRLAEVFGAIGVKVERDDEIGGAVETIVRAEEPVVVDLRVSQEDLPPLNLEATLRMSQV